MCKNNIFYFVVYGFMFFVGGILILGGGIEIMTGYDIIEGSVVQSIVVIGGGAVLIVIAAMGVRNEIGWMKITKEYGCS